MMKELATAAEVAATHSEHIRKETEKLSMLSEAVWVREWAGEEEHEREEAKEKMEEEMDEDVDADNLKSLRTVFHE